ncbi:restriction endonuclease subunit S [Vibrio tubiashii]|uniref:restriction endonuclease subunit S n=1 Tax=Vibrio tubiashii TaxID=29498 RepID=UPI00234E5F66|nr:restriction endonuclease subunit S [Vibrio tubiashii]WCP67408.1 restriction endonuclease subunit S [Vibrio tubiashii]
MELSVYDHYSESDILWVGQYPSHWNLTRVKYEAYVKARVGWHGLKSDDFTDEGPYLVTGSDFKGPRIRWSDCYHCDLKRYEQDPYIQLTNGDLLITKDGTIGKVALVDGLGDDEKATLNSGVFVVRPLRDNFLTKFYFWLLQSRVFTDFVNYNKTGSTIVHLYQDTFVNFAYASPDIAEQTQIANFLDHETTKIDTLIEKQQQLIKLLKEKRQAVISHAVTKGLNPQAPMKDSGVEWLGEVPEHWVVSPIKHLLRQKKGAVKAGPFGSHLKNSDMDGGDVKVITQKNVIKKNLSIGDSFISEQKYRELSGFTIEKEDVLITTRGTIGRTCVYSDEAVAILHPCLIRMQCDETKVIPELLALIIQDSGYAMEQILVKSNATTIEVIYSDNLVNTEICVPKTIDEQVRLLEFVELETDKFDSLVRKAESAISLMQERRTALISAAVTGKIDVRNWQAPTSENQALEQTA